MLLMAPSDDEIQLFQNRFLEVAELEELEELEELDGWWLS